MQYIHKYLTTSAFNEDWNGSYKEPWVSLNKENGIITFNWDPDTNEKSYVDLGLPSGNLWATSNLPKYFYRWGELEGTTLTATISESTYRWGSDLTKYNNTDNLTKLQLEDDAARIIYGGDWCIPTCADFEELFENTTINNTGTLYVALKSNINGRTITFQKYGSKDHTATNSYGHGSGVYGYYWTSELKSENISKACCAIIGGNLKVVDSTNGHNRYCALCVRPIIRRIW